MKRPRMRSETQGFRGWSWENTSATSHVDIEMDRPVVVMSHGACNRVVGVVGRMSVGKSELWIALGRRWYELPPPAVAPTFIPGYDDPATFPDATTDLEVIEPGEWKGWERNTFYCGYGNDDGTLDTSGPLAGRWSPLRRAGRGEWEFELVTDAGDKLGLGGRVWVVECECGARMMLDERRVRRAVVSFTLADKRPVKLVV